MERAESKIFSTTHNQYEWVKIRLGANAIICHQYKIRNVYILTTDATLDHGVVTFRNLGRVHEFLQECVSYLIYTVGFIKANHLIMIRFL